MKQECIPVGGCVCVEGVSQHELGRGVSAGGCLPRGVCLPRWVSVQGGVSAQEDVCPEGCLSRGVCLPKRVSAQGVFSQGGVSAQGISAQGDVFPGGLPRDVCVCPSMQWGRHPPVDRQTPVKT